MSRIRSIHPGLWTDEAFMGLSAYARLLYIGLWNEAFDDGVFEWKPLTIKARIFPVDSVDVPALLGELVQADCIAERGKYGLIRNFRHYQRPKKPNSSGLLQADDHGYVGLVPNQSPTGVEEDDQMEDGGGKREQEEEKKAPLSPPGGEAGASFEDVEKAFPRSPHYSQAKAERAYRRLSQSDQQALRSKAIAFGAWWTAEQVRRNRSIADSLPFVPPLDKWIVDGAWRSFEPAAAPSQAASLPILREGDPLIPIIEKLRGKAIIFGTKGTTTVTPAELERARSAA
jgi:hypothetical protein